MPSDNINQHVLAVDEEDHHNAATVTSNGKFVVDKRRSRTLNNVVNCVVGGSGVGAHNTSVSTTAASHKLSARLTMSMLPEHLRGNKAQ